MTDREKELEAELERYKKWVADLQSGMYLNCVYCGYSFGKEDVLHKAEEDGSINMAQILAAHVSHCPRHPMWQLRNDYDHYRNMEHVRKLEWRDVYEDEACDTCHGSGKRLYPSTSTWRGGIGGSMMTTDICDKCWGSGDKLHPWLDLRALKESK